MTETKGQPTNLMESWPQEHRDIVISYVDQINDISVVKIVFALSKGDALFISAVIESEEEGWDDIAHIEYDLTHKFKGTTIVFKEIDKMMVDEDRAISQIPDESVVVFESAF